MKAIFALVVLLPLVAKGQLAGGNTDITLDGSDPNEQFAVKAINHYYTMLGDSETRTLVQVKSAQSQVVAGTLYHLVLHVMTGSQEELCKVEVWSRPWLSGDEALQVTRDPACHAINQDQVMQTAKMAGAPTLVDMNDKDVMNALMFATTTMNAQENYMFYRKPVKVEEVKSQVVSGMAYHFRGVHMAATDCSKSMNTVDMTMCNAAADADTRMCDFDVWWQSWMTPEYKLTNVHCQ